MQFPTPATESTGAREIEIKVIRRWKGVFKMTATTQRCIIPLTKGKHTIVDPEDYEQQSKHKWYANRGDSKKIPRYYAVRQKNKKALLMHREIMNCPKGMEVDHINGDTLDNRKANLRICTHAENSQNSKGKHNSTSQYKGVWSKDGKWAAKIGYMKGDKYIGSFPHEVMAAKAYDDSAKRIFGEFAWLNFPHRVRRRNIYRRLMATNGRIFTVIFIKRSTGKEKKLFARVGVKTRQKGKGLRYNSSEKKLIVVYDMKERTYKSIPIDGIEAVTIRGKRYRVD